ncbi:MULTISPECIES: alkyl/aryl-sulfatase [Mesorhizobium]|uniref:Linear primary-alkylsulfatase n=1 Tax=Mesorhizobium denitrificans TaxID=2294114 RepID=A0A371XEJ4_9HYPH|nr:MULTISPECIES: alkyl sulfatase dimerization domain-containing protein [Mesorhizobium]RFC67655.1 MBL fold metallo-hydrolase [Mesorhizobium denitrificans]
MTIHDNNIVGTFSSRKSTRSRKYSRLLLTSSLLAFGLPLSGGFAFADPATEATKASNKAVLEALPFNDRQDFEDAQRGLLRKPETLIIKKDNGDVVWDLESYKKFIAIENPAPDTVNPSLWRNAQLNVQYGLYEVVDGIYQVRGYDLANITFIRGDTGWIIFDVGSASETAKAAYDLVSEQFGKLPVVGVMYSHSHGDHYGGVKGVVSEEDVKSGKVPIIAPEGFMQHAVSEGVIAGNAMSRRATYMYGVFLPRNEEGSVGAGLGLTNPLGTFTLIAPTETITETGQTLTVDGVEMVFQMTPGTEAPSEMNIYLPKFKAMWMAENTTNTMHNILTLRGAQVRDALNWAKYINQTIELYGDKVDVKFQSHHTPKWGQDNIIDYLKRQRDLYKFIHDRSVNLMNQGYNGEEISEVIKLPASLESLWSGRGYYGTLRHNARAVYQRYMGWYDANPSDLNNLPPVDAAKKYVEYMGGEDAILKKAQADFDKGEYRWIATALKHVVFANPDSEAGKAMLARTYEQLGYQAESGPWRSVYLQGAFELRNGVPNIKAPSSASPDAIRAMDPEMLFDFLGVRLNAEKAEGKKLTLNINFTDIGKKYTVTVENSVLNYTEKQVTDADATATLTKVALDDVQLGTATIEQKIQSGDIKMEGNQETLPQFLGLFDNFEYWFNIVTP